MYVFTFFFSKSQKHDFLHFFELLHTFSRTLVLRSDIIETFKIMNGLYDINREMFQASCQWKKGS